MLPCFAQEASCGTAQVKRLGQDKIRHKGGEMLLAKGSRGKPAPTVFPLCGLCLLGGKYFKLTLPNGGRKLWFVAFHR